MRSCSLLNPLAFPAHGVAFGRIAILLALAAAAILGLALPLVRLTRAWAVRRAEAANPELEQRLTTFQERESKGGDPFLELLAADTLAHTQNCRPPRSSPTIVSSRSAAQDSPVSSSWSG